MLSILKTFIFYIIWCDINKQYFRIFSGERLHSGGFFSIRCLTSICIPITKKRMIAWRKAVAVPLLIQWSYCSLGLSHWYGLTAVLYLNRNSYTHTWKDTLQWHHNKRDGISNHRHLACVLNHLFRASADQRKHQSSASLAIVRWIHWRPVNYPHKGPVTRKMFPFDDIIMQPKTGPSHLM